MRGRPIALHAHQAPDRCRGTYLVEKPIASGNMSRMLGLIAMMGLPGAGKSTLALPLARALDAWIVSRDTIRLAMFDPCEFTDTEKHAAFQGVLSAIQANCELGRISVVDGMPFSRVGEYETAARTVSQCGRIALPILLNIAPEVAAARIVAQTEDGRAPADDRTSELPEDVSRRFRSPPPGALLLDAERPPEHLLRSALEWIDQCLSKHAELPSCLLRKK
jgi:predicted kinase